MLTFEGKFSTSRVMIDEVEEGCIKQIIQFINHKDPKVIEEAIKPTAKILDKVKPIINIKDDTKDKRRKKKKG